MEQKLKGTTLGKPIRYNRVGRNVRGDTWACAWSEDDVIYTVMDDTPGFDLVLNPSKDRNLAIGTFGVSTPPELVGTMVNGMEVYGCANQLGSDGASWKGNGIICVNNVLYLSVSRHWYHVKEFDHRQIARDASIVKSEDKGQTWKPQPYDAQPLPNPLFPGQRFATPFFVDFGRDGDALENLPHEADRYVYAISTDGYWNNGNGIHLARVLRTDLPKLELESWEFYCGTRDGYESPIWRPGKAGLEACYPILSKPYRFGQTGMTYLEHLKRYLLLGWHYPRLGKDSWQHQTSVWDFYEAPTPWGPWTLFASQTWETEGFYNPIIPSKFISQDNRQMWALTSGDFNTHDKDLETTLYTLYMVPITLEYQGL